MKLKGIIFDKDGTLIDFDAFWVSVTVKAISEVLSDTGLGTEPQAEILEAFGVHNGKTDINGVLCKGTYEQMGTIVYNILKNRGCVAEKEDVIASVISAYERNADAGEVKPTCPELRCTLEKLKSMGIRLAVVTTDNETITRKCLRDLGIDSLFDKIYTDNGIYPPKPDPYCANDFSKSFGIEKELSAMVGDTVTDVRFSKNAGIRAISLASSEESRDILAKDADVVISKISELLDLIGQVEQ